MKHLIQRCFMFVMLAALLVACGGETPATSAPASSAGATAPTTAVKPTDKPAVATQPAATAPASGLGDILNNKGEKISVTIGGNGPNAGTYETTSTEGACSTGLTGAGSGGWGNQYSIITTDPKEFSSLQLIANIKAGETTTTDFMTMIAFGELFSASSKTYEINALDGNAGAGKGTVSINDKGDTATITIKGDTAEGTPIEATIECLSVLRFNAPSDAGSDEPITPANGLKLTIKGGDLAGSYDLAPSGKISTCGAGANNSSFLAEGLEEAQRMTNFTFEYNNQETAEKINTLQLLVINASAGPTKQFYLDINDQTYYLENLSGSTDIGTVEVDDRGDSATITLNAKDDQGNTITGSIECNSIQRD